MKRHPLVAFCVLTFLISWSLWIPIMAIQNGTWQVDNPDGWILGLWKWGGFAPCFAAVIMAYATGGMDGLHKLMSRFVRWKVGFRWYVIVLFLPAVFSLSITVVHMMLGGDGPDFSTPKIYLVGEIPGFYGKYTAWTILIPMFFQNLFLGSPVDGTPIGEETGWRGYALPHLQGRFTALTSSVALGLIWGFWQWPLFWTPDLGALFTSYGLVFLGVIPGAILVTWIFNNTGGSLLLVLLYSNSLKMTDWFLPAPLGIHPLVTVFVLWVAAITVVLINGSSRLTKKEWDSECREEIPSPSVAVTQELPSVK